MFGLLSLETPFGVKIHLPTGHCNVLQGPCSSQALCAAGWAELELGAAFSTKGAGLAPAGHALGVPPCLPCSHGVSPAAGHFVPELCHSQCEVCLGSVRKSNLESIGGQGGRGGRGKEGIWGVEWDVFPFSHNKHIFRLLI